MSETHVISALRDKRAEIGGHIQDLEKRLAYLRANMANIDAAIRLLSPGTDPCVIPPKRIHKRTRYFARGELPRLILDALRNAKEPVTAEDIASAAIRAKELPASTQEAIVAIVLMALRSFTKRGVVARIGVGREAKWAVTQP